MRWSGKLALLGGIAAASLALSACTTTSTPYQPLSASNQVSGGYSDVELAPGRYRVTFAGNSLTSREQVETYLLYRAAELTLQQGFDWFTIRDREVEHRVEKQARPDTLYDPWLAYDYPYWRPYWRYYGPGIGWHTWYPYSGDPFWTSRVDSRSIERYEVSAEIQMGHGAMPATDLRAFDARDVIAQLGPGIKKPDR